MEHSVNQEIFICGKFSVEVILLRDNTYPFLYLERVLYDIKTIYQACSVL